MRAADSALIASRLVRSAALPFPPSPPRLRLAQRRERPPRVAVVPPPRSCSTMESARVDDAAGVKKEECKIEEKPAAAEPSSPPPLQPPEKPLPGDCCGSGCVRCVWDIYYEELEAYNNSIASKTKNPQS